MEFISIFISIALFGLTIRALKMTTASFTWSKTKGVIGIGPIDEYRGYIRVKGEQLAYAYNYDDKEYFSKRVFAPISDNLFVYLVFFNSNNFVNQNYEHGQVVDVFVNPKNPTQSCLKQGGSKYVLIELSIWCVVLLLLLASWQ